MRKWQKIAEPGAFLDAEDVCGADAEGFLAAQVSLAVIPHRNLGHNAKLESTACYSAIYQIA